jgi:hypothetical protein
MNHGGTPLKYLLAITLCLLVSPAFAGTMKDKKIIEYGLDFPNTSVVRERIKEYEATTPFDGLVIIVSARNGLTLGWHMFQTEKLDPADFQQAIDDLKATTFTKFTDNFIQTLSSPSDADWFDPKWSNICYNASLFARVAKQGGCKGLMFDAEMYNQQIWSYFTGTGKRPNHTLEECRQMARQRGREMMTAINKEFPDVTILTLFGPAQLYLETGGNEKLFEIAPNVLLSAFYDGMCEAATPETVIVDGFETSYSYRDREEFAKARKIMLEETPKISMNPEAFKKHVRAGFGLWPTWQDESRKLLFNRDDYSRNYHTPAGFRAAANYALRSSDKYVWVFGTPPKSYMEALGLAKSGPGPGEKNRLELPKPQSLKAADIEGYSDDQTFAEMRKTMTEIFDFPKDGWRFALDPKDAGIGRKWFDTDFNDSRWHKILIGKWWEEQGYEYNGIAWYRKKFTAPDIKPGKKVFVAVGASDDYAKVWLNGQFIGEEHLPIAVGWNTPFAMDVTDSIKPGEANVLTIRVEDPGAYGGLWKSIKLMVK